MATLAILFTGLGILALWFVFIGAFTGMLKHGSVGFNRDTVRREALQKELDVVRDSLREKLDAASGEERKSLEAKLNAFQRESNVILHSFDAEEQDYRDQLETSQDNIKRQYENRQQGKKMLPTLLIALFGISGMTLIIPGSVCGWSYLKRIRNASNKTGWLRAMIAALLVPVFLLWLIPWLIGVTIGSQIGFDFDLREIGQFLGGLIAFVFSVIVISLIIWRTYRWVFPRPRAVPSPKGWAVWGTCLVLVSFLIPTIQFGLFVMVKSSDFSAHAGLARWELEYQKKRSEYDTSISRLRTDIKENNDERRTHVMQLSIDNLEQNKELDRQQYESEKERFKKRAETFNTMLLIGSNIVNLLGIGIAITGTVFGWRYLALVRGREKKPALIAGYFAALAFPLSTMVSVLGLLANYIFQQGDWGAQQKFVVAVASTVGVLFGITLAGYVIYLTARWVSGSRKPETLQE